MEVKKETETETLDEIAQQREECKHPEGWVEQRYDEDGCGYRIWHCNFCNYWVFDHLA